MEKIIRMAKRINGRRAALSLLTMAFCVIMCSPAFASGVSSARAEIADVLGGFVDIIVLIFQAVGVLLGTYSIGSLILAFKNEDAASKSRAATMLVVSVCLFAMPSFVQAVDLVDRLK